MCGCLLNKESLGKELDFVRQEIQTMEERMKQMKRMPMEEQRSDDWKQLYFGYERVRSELKSLIRYSYDSE